MSLPSPDPISGAVSGAKLLIVTVLVVAGLGIIGYLAYTKSLLQTQLAQAETSITALTAANENWKTTSDQANAALAAAQVAEKQRAAAAQAAVDAAQAVSTQDAKDAAAILAVAAPAPVLAPAGAAPPLVVSDPQCQAAEKLTNSFFKVKK